MDVVHHFSVHQRTKIVESYFSIKSVVLTQRENGSMKKNDNEHCREIQEHWQCGK